MLVSASGEGQGRKVGWNSRTEYVVDNQNGSYTSTFYLGPQVYLNNATGEFEKLRFVVDPSFKTQQGTRFFLQNAHVAVEVANQAVTYFDPDYQKLCIASEMFTVESPQGQGWRDTGIGTATPTWSYQNDSRSVNLTRTQAIQGIGQFNLTYSLQVGAFLKHTVSFRSDQAGTFRVAMHLDGIANNHVKTNSANVYDVTSETHIVDSGFIVGSNNTNLVYQENLASVFNQTNTATTGNLTDIVFNNGANGMKADIYIGNWNLLVNGVLGFDPDTSTYPIISDDYDGHVYISNADYAIAQGSSTGSSANAISITLGQQYPGIYVIDRAFVRFNTSTLLSTSAITSASLGFAAGFIYTSGSNFTIKIQKWTEASDGITTADYNGFDGTNYDDNSFNTSSLTQINTLYYIPISNFNLFTISGYTDICLRSGNDVSVIAPSGDEYLLLVDSASAEEMVLSVTTIYGNEYVYPDVNDSDVDSSANIGSQGNFTAQNAKDLVNDTLTEAAQYTYSNSTVLNDGFESGTTNWDGNGGSGFSRVTTYTASGETINPQAGSYFMVAPESTSGQYLACDNLDMSSAVTIYISFYYFDDDIDSGDFTLTYYDGAGYDTIQALDAGTESTWQLFSAKITDSQYFDSTFRIRINCATGNNEACGVDAVTIIRESVASTNYRLDIEEQFTNANYTRANEELCIFTGNGWTGTAENLMVQAWNGSWNWVMNLTANQWNNASVSTWLTSATFTIRFVDGTQSGDTSQNAWTKDCTLLHTWDGAGGTEYPVSITITYASTQTITIDSTFSKTIINSAEFEMTESITLAYLKSLALSNTFDQTINTATSIKPMDLGYTAQTVDTQITTYNEAITVDNEYNVASTVQTAYTLTFDLAPTFGLTMESIMSYIQEMILGFTSSLTVTLASTFNKSFDISNLFSLSANIVSAFNINLDLTKQFTMSLASGMTYVKALVLGFTGSLTAGIASTFNNAISVVSSFNLIATIQSTYQLATSITSNFSLTLASGLSYLKSLALSFTGALHISTITSYTNNLLLAQLLGLIVAPQTAFNLSISISSTFESTINAGLEYIKSLLLGFTGGMTIDLTSVFSNGLALTGLFDIAMATSSIYNVAVSLSKSLSLTLSSGMEYIQNLILGFTNTLTVTSFGTFYKDFVLGVSYTLTSSQQSIFNLTITLANTFNTTVTSGMEYIKALVLGFTSSLTNSLSTVFSKSLTLTGLFSLSLSSNPIYSVALSLSQSFTLTITSGMQYAQALLLNFVDSLTLSSFATYNKGFDLTGTFTLTSAQHTLYNIGVGLSQTFGMTINTGLLYVRSLILSFTNSLNIDTITTFNINSLLSKSFGLLSVPQSIFNLNIGLTNIFSTTLSSGMYYVKALTLAFASSITTALTTLFNVEASANGLYELLTGTIIAFNLGITNGYTVSLVTAITSIFNPVLSLTGAFAQTLFIELTQYGGTLYEVVLTLDYSLGGTFSIITTFINTITSNFNISGAVSVVSSFGVAISNSFTTTLELLSSIVESLAVNLSLAFAMIMVQATSGSAIPYEGFWLYIVLMCIIGVPVALIFVSPYKRRRRNSW